ncbi:MAG: TonB-dependent receptor [Treponema sp.]|jgi:outer membrane receptor protein involved in Fe transport|nr:TonB-dependent receptor [Treponema sp.]
MLVYERPCYHCFTRLGTGAVIPRFYLVSIKLSSELTEHISLSVGIENLLDTNYSLDSAYLAMPGRTFQVGFKATY